MNMIKYHIKKTHSISISILIILSIFLAGCSNSIVSDKNLTFEEYTDEVFKHYASSDALSLNFLLTNPEDYKIKALPYTLGTVGVETFNSERDYARTVLRELTNYEYDKLSNDEKIVYDTITWNLNKLLEMDEYDLYYEYLNPVTGIQAQLPILLSEYHFYTAYDIANYLEMLPTVYDYIKSICEYETEKSDNGLFMSLENSELVIEQCKDFIENPEENILITIFNDKIDSFDGLTQSFINDCKQRNYDIVMDNVIPAYQLLIDTLASLSETGTNDAGLCAFEKGADYYEALVQYNVGTSRDMESIKTLLANTITLDTANYLNTLSTADVSKLQLSDIFNSTNADAIIEDLKYQTIPTYPEIEKIDYTIKSVPAVLEKHLSPALYLSSPIDDYNNNVIYINNSLDYINEPLFTNIAHEAWPGHMYQNAYFCQNNQYDVLNVFKNLGYIEGWATYVTTMSYYYCNLDEKLASVKSAEYSMLLCISAMSDIGVNYDGWDKSELGNYLVDNNIKLDEEGIDSLYNSVIADPGNYVTYALGYAEIRKLKESAKAHYGDSFDELGFHTFILDMGPVPFDIIIEEYEESFAPVLSYSEITNSN